MTIASVWYQKQQEAAQEEEMHFKIARGHSIPRVRKELAKRGIQYYQRSIYRRTKRWIPKKKIKVRFERETPASKTERTIRVASRSMQYRGRQWKALPLPSRLISYVKRQYKRTFSK
jgi:(p)ppGpp synthase/HD superfamily hydrolase